MWDSEEHSDDSPIVPLPPRQRAYLEALLRTSGGLADSLGHSGHHASARMMDLCSSVLEAKLRDAGKLQRGDDEEPHYHHQQQQQQHHPGMVSPHHYDDGSMLDESPCRAQQPFEQLPPAAEVAAAAAGCDAGGPMMYEENSHSMLSLEEKYQVAPCCPLDLQDFQSGKDLDPRSAISPPITTSTTAAARQPFSSLWAGGVEDYHGIISVLWAIMLIVISTVANLYHLFWLRMSELICLQGCSSA